MLKHSDIDTPPAYRLLGVVAEPGDIAAEVNETTGYGTDSTALGKYEGQSGTNGTPASGN